MAEHRFYLGNGPLGPAGSEVALAGETAHRITRVLRMRPGALLGLFSAGHEFACELLGTTPRVRVRLLEELPPLPPVREVTLYQALIRPNRFEWLVEKVAEIGVSEIVPLVTDYSTVRSAEIGPSRLERWRRIAIEASEQSGRRTVPSIGSPMNVALALQYGRGQLVFAWEGLRGEPPRPRLDDGCVSLFIGPEGGWSEPEVERAGAAGAHLLSLGPHILRAETAAIVAATLVLLQ